MKSLGLCILNVALLAMLVACGKDNESGKNSYSNPYYSNQYGTISSPYSSGSYSVNSIISQTPCMTTGYATQNRVQLQMTVALNGVLTANDTYVASTTMGDVAVLVGQGSNQALVVAYICQRGVTYQNQTPQILDLAYGAQTICQVKPMNRLTLYVPGGVSPLYFRMIDYGTSQNTGFQACGGQIKTN